MHGKHNVLLFLLFSLCTNGTDKSKYNNSYYDVFNGTYPLSLNQDAKEICQPGEFVCGCEEDAVRLATPYLRMNCQDHHLDNDMVSTSCQYHCGGDHLDLDPIYGPWDQVKLLWPLVTTMRSEHEFEGGVFRSFVDGENVWLEGFQLHSTSKVVGA